MKAKSVSSGYGLMSQLTVEQFTRALQSRGGRLALINEGGLVRASLSGFETLSTELMAHADFADHEAIFLQVSTTGKLMAAFVHRTRRGPAAGGTRAWNYPSMESFLRDGLRLSRGMTHKNASAHLWWGGGKGLVHGADALDPAERARLFREYGRFISTLRGCYFTAKDVGTTSNDVAEIYRTTRFVTCIPPEYGGSGNPSGATAEGVLRGIEAVAEEMGCANLQGLTVAVQGLGEVGSRLVWMLLQGGATVKAFDPNAKRCQDIGRLSPHVTVECRSDDAVLAVDCDILAPCALGGILNDSTIPTLKAKAICGAANNQLAVPDTDGLMLKKRGILYAPDFIVNRMGIVGCADEAFGFLEDDPDILRHLDKTWDGGVFLTTKRVLRDAAKHDSTPNFEAVKLAEELSLQPHPMRGHRAYQQACQVASDWASCDLHRHSS